MLQLFFFLMSETASEEGIIQTFLNLESLISAMIGGVLVIAGQYIIEKYKNTNTKNNALREITSLLTEKKVYLRNLFRELAMYKTHASYWWYCTKKDESFSTTEAEKHRQDHLRSQAEARKVEKDIGRTVASFLGLVTKYQLISGNKLDIDEHISKIEAFKFRKAKDYDSSLEYDKVRNDMVIKDEEKLKQSYFRNMQPIEEIVRVVKQKT